MSTNVKFKYVTAPFKERHHNGTKGDTRHEQTPLEFLRWVGHQFNVEARFAKAVQHLRDRPDDEKIVAKLITLSLFERLRGELNEDLEKEYGDVITSYLEAYMPTFYKNYNKKKIPTADRDSDNWMMVRRAKTIEECLVYSRELVFAFACDGLDQYLVR